MGTETRRHALSSRIATKRKSRTMSIQQPSEILSKPSLSALSFILRHRELWPDTFKEWNFSDCRSCAIGLSFCLWPNIAGRGGPSCRAFFREMGLLYEEGCILFGYGLLPEIDDNDITPDHVADAIEAHLAQQVSGSPNTRT